MTTVRCVFGSMMINEPEDLAMPVHPSRRRLLLAGACATVATGVHAGFGEPAFAQQELSPTPACDDGDAPTIRQTEGPFFKPNSPERADLRDEGIKGQGIELTGFVLTRGCRPVERALVDLWHADNEGNYDNSGFRLRGHQFTDAEGRFRFRTIVPAAYV